MLECMKEARGDRHHFLFAKYIKNIIIELFIKQFYFLLIFTMKEKWIQDAIKKKWALRAELWVKKWEKIPQKLLVKASKEKWKTGYRARLAMTLSKFKKK